MSKRIDFNNNNISAVDCATIAPNQAPNATPDVAKSSKMTFGARIIGVLLMVLAVCAIALLIVNLIVNSYAMKLNAGHYEKVEIIPAQEIADMGIYNEPYITCDEYKAAANDILLNYAEASHSIKDADHIYNYAIYGINKFADSDKGVATFILIASFNKETKKVTYLTFTETALVYIPMVGIGRLRDSYEFGGAALLTKTLKHNFGFQIEGYIETDMTAAAKLIDSVGGVNVKDTTAIELKTAIDSYNEKFGTTVEVPTDSNGKAHLDGMQAIAFLRASNANAGKVMKSLGVSLFTSGIGGMRNAFDLIIGGTKISMVREDLTTLAKMSLFMLKEAELNAIDIGDESKVSLYHKGNYAYVISGEAERAKLIETIYGSSENK